MKNHKYISRIGMEYYWYGCMYIRMQPSTATLPPYALIQTTQTPFTEKEFEELGARNVLKEIEYQEFLKAYERAVEITETISSFINASPDKPTISKPPAALSHWNRIEDKKPIAYEKGIWDGLRSDKLLVRTKSGEVRIAVMYAGFMDGSEFCEFYDDRDYDVKEITHWAEIELP
jgi:hypothetical protein